MKSQLTIWKGPTMPDLVRTMVPIFNGEENGWAVYERGPVCYHYGKVRIPKWLWMRFYQRRVHARVL